jgi:acetyl-CoA carboxylase alpha subunit
MQVEQVSPTDPKLVIYKLSKEPISEREKANFALTEQKVKLDEKIKELQSKSETSKTEIVATLKSGQKSIAA